MATRELEARVRAHIKASESQIEAFTLRLQKFLDRSLDSLIGELEIGTDAGIDAAQTLGGLFQSLKELGLDAELGRLRTIYAGELKHINAEFARLGNQRALADADKVLVETLITFDTDKVSNKINGYVDDVRSTLIRQVIGGEKPDFKPLRNTVGDRLISNLETEANTMIAGFNRTVTAAKAQELGFNLMIYIGPEDQVTRPFCSEVLSRDPAIYTIDEIKSMNNGQGLSVLEYGGGYNCRHQWRPISQEMADKEGYDGGD